MTNDDYMKTYGRLAPVSSLDPPVSKSWLFEIVDSSTGSVEESFTLILPPTSISIKEPQRVNITKTFGNAFVDDYGSDNLQITLKGISGTAHAFPTFTTIGQTTRDVPVYDQDSSENAYTGKDSFYAFRNSIIRYKDRENWDTRELRVYDLYDLQIYKCVLLDFTVDRQAEQPIHRYPFTISLFVYQKLDKYKPESKAINISKNPTTALNEIDSIVDKILALYGDIKEIINQVYLLKAKALELRTRINMISAQVSRLLTAPLDLAKSLIDTGFAAMGIAYDVYQAGKYTFDRYMSIEEMLRQSLNEGLRIYGYQISQGWQLSRTINLEKDRGIEITDTDITRQIEDNTYSFNGLNEYTIKGGDTLQRIAQNTLGNSNLWVYIASVNDSIMDNSDLVIGNTLYIPVQTSLSENNKSQYILTENVVRDSYGTDIAIDSEGGIVIQENGDFKLINGIANVQQSVNLRINTLAGNVLTQTAFGITANAGLAGTTMAINYLKMSVKLALTIDPRIDSINNLQIKIYGDVIQMSMTIILVGSDQTLPVFFNL